MDLDSANRIYGCCDVHDDHGGQMKFLGRMHREPA